MWFARTTEYVLERVEPYWLSSTSLLFVLSVQESALRLSNSRVGRRLLRATLTAASRVLRRHYRVLPQRLVIEDPRVEGSTCAGQCTRFEPFASPMVEEIQVLPLPSVKPVTSTGSSRVGEEGIRRQLPWGSVPFDEVSAGDCMMCWFTSPTRSRSQSFSPSQRFLPT